MRVTHKGNSFVSGTYWRECDRCGFDYLRKELVKEWTGLIVCRECNDPLPREMKRIPNFKEKPFKRD